MFQPPAAHEIPDSPPAIAAIHETEEGRPIETLWDATVAATAHARSVQNTDKRLEIERAAGELLKLAA
jgi:hypothetical protein